MFSSLQKKRGVEHGPKVIRDAGLMERLSNFGKCRNLGAAGGAGLCNLSVGVTCSLTRQTFRQT